MLDVLWTSLGGGTHAPGDQNNNNHRRGHSNAQQRNPPSRPQLAHQHQQHQNHSQRRLNAGLPIHQNGTHFAGMAQDEQTAIEDGWAPRGSFSTNGTSASSRSLMSQKPPPRRGLQPPSGVMRGDGSYFENDDIASDNGRRMSNRSQALLSASRSVQSTRSLGSGSAGGSINRSTNLRNAHAPPPNNRRGYSMRNLNPNPSSSDSVSLGGGSGTGSLSFGGGSSSQPNATNSMATTHTTASGSGSDTRSTSITLSDALYQNFPPTRSNDGNTMPPYDEEGAGGYGMEDEEDERTLMSYQTSGAASSAVASIFGGGASSVGGQSELQREEMLGELRQLLDGE